MVAALGAPWMPSPGDWHIDEIATFPWFQYDEGVLERGERAEDFFNFPPGPRNPVGILWMQLDRPNIAGSNAQNSITGTRTKKG
jgi:hypothetical protein